MNMLSIVYSRTETVIFLALTNNIINMMINICESIKMTFGHDERVPIDGRSYVLTTPSSWPMINTILEDLSNSNE